MSTTSAKEEVADNSEAPYGLSQGSYDNLHIAFRSGLAAAPGFGAAFGLFCAALGSIATGIFLLCFGSAVSLIYFLRRRSFYKITSHTLRVQALSAACFQLCFITPAVVVAAKLMSINALALCVLGMAAAVFSYARYYYRAYWRAWEEKKRHNETRSLDLEHGLYFPTEPFQTTDVRSLGWDEKIGKALCVIGPLGGGALGVVAGRGEGVGALMILCVAFSFFIGMAWSQMTVQVVVNWQKIRHYEREIDQPIRNQ